MAGIGLVVFAEMGEACLPPGARRAHNRKNSAH